MHTDPVADAVRIAHVSKTFGATRALRDVGFTLGEGRIHALMGGNGSGKSTLIKILAGVQSADPGGTIHAGARALDASSMSPGAARDAGFRFVHQHPTTFGDLTVAENLALGHGFPVGAGRRIRWRELHARSTAVLQRFEIDAAPTARLDSLGPAARTTVAIARALQDLDEADRGLLVLDEPTASLPRTEVELLLAALRRFAAQGRTILVVSHRLDEVRAVADEVTVLRDGALVWTRPAEDVSGAQLIDAMVGRTLEQLPTRASAPGRGTALDVRGLRGGPLRDVDLRLRAGEIVGIAGLLGSGRSELLQMIFGARGRDGTVEVDGTPLPPGRIRAAIAAHVAYVPEDRPSDGALPEMTVAENLSAASIRSYWRRLHLDQRRERVDADETVAAFAIRTASSAAPLATLSGGNQQKVMLARWMPRRPRVLLLDEPTQGVDVGARADIYATLRAAADDGCAVLVVSSDFEELVELCDRVEVLAGGRLHPIHPEPKPTSQDLMHHVYAAESA